MYWVRIPVDQGLEGTCSVEAGQGIDQLTFTLGKPGKELVYPVDGLLWIAAEDPTAFRGMADAHGDNLFYMIDMKYYLLILYRATIPS